MSPRCEAVALVLGAWPPPVATRDGTPRGEGGQYLAHHLRVALDVGSNVQHGIGAHEPREALDDFWTHHPPLRAATPRVGEVDEYLVEERAVREPALQQRQRIGAHNPRIGELARLQLYAASGESAAIPIDADKVFIGPTLCKSN